MTDDVERDGRSLTPRDGTVADSQWAAFADGWQARAVAYLKAASAQSDDGRIQMKPTEAWLMLALIELGKLQKATVSDPRGVSEPNPYSRESVLEEAAVKCELAAGLNVHADGIAAALQCARVIRALRLSPTESRGGLEK